MLFVLLFISAVLIVPLMQDAEKHPSDNIFSRSGRDVLRFQLVQSTLKTIHVSAGRVNSAVVGVASSAAVIVSLFVVFFFLRLIFIPINHAINYLLQ